MLCVTKAQEPERRSEEPTGPVAVRRLWNQLIIFLQSDCDTVFLGFCDEVIFRALPVTSQIQGRREILYFGLKSHVIFISITLPCSRWLMCLVIALFLGCETAPPPFVSGSIQVGVARALCAWAIFVCFVCMFVCLCVFPHCIPGVSETGKLTSVRCHTVSHPPSRTYLLKKKKKE